MVIYTIQKEVSVRERNKNSVLRVQLADLEQYKPDQSIWQAEPDKVHKIKSVIAYRLTEVERRIILLYAELGSCKKLGNILNVSTSTAYLQVKQIQKKIIDLL